MLGEGNYVRIEEGLTDAMAHDEARRCLRCDLCIGCGLCMATCSEMGIEALRMADTPAGRLAYFDFLRPAERCIGCGACTGLPDGRNPNRGWGRRASHDHHRNCRARTVAAGLQRMRRADADSCAPGLCQAAFAGSHGGPP